MLKPQQLLTWQASPTAQSALESQMTAPVQNTMADTQTPVSSGVVAHMQSECPPQPIVYVPQVCPSQGIGVQTPPSSTSPSQSLSTPSQTSSVGSPGSASHSLAPSTHATVPVSAHAPTPTVQACPTPPGSLSTIPSQSLSTPSQTSALAKWSPCARWAGTAAGPTLMLCGLLGLPGGMWQTFTFGAPAIAAEPSKSTPAAIKSVLAFFMVLLRGCVRKGALRLPFPSGTYLSTRGARYAESRTRC